MLTFSARALYADPGPENADQETSGLTSAVEDAAEAATQTAIPEHGRKTFMSPPFFPQSPVRESADRENINRKSMDN
ncbi:MAG TPA: hypothetical protein ENJ80_08195 [Gammaproteobacteria bacterium]|nr:hypothetical protein [Gammaproteobacteria bacterium]